MKISVIICTHNPRLDYLQLVLKSLEEQTLAKKEWELLLIDNRSDKSLKKTVDLFWHPYARIVRENKLGLTHARMRGIKESKTEILIFVDDDNILNKDYLEQAVSIAARLPCLGCFGAAKIIPLFEKQPKKEILEVADMLALRNILEDKWSNLPDDDYVPWGAGLVVRASVAKKHSAALRKRKSNMQLDRSGHMLLSCGDNDFSWTACKNGYAKGVFTALRVSHLIPDERLKESYLCRIAEGHGFSHVFLHAIHKKNLDLIKTQPSKREVLKAFFEGNKKVIVQWLRCFYVRRNQSPLKRAVMSAFERGIRRAVAEIHEPNKRSNNKPTK